MLGKLNPRIRGNRAFNPFAGSSTPTNTAYVAQGTSATLASNTAYRITASTLNLTLPASPADNDWIILEMGGSFTGCVALRNGKTIMGLSEDMNLNLTYFAIKLVYHSATGDWRLAL